MRNLKHLPLLFITCLSLSVMPAKAEETLKPSELPAKYLVERGNRKSDLNDIEGAIADYKAALKIKPDYVRAYFNLGIAACNTGDPHGEILYFSKAFEIDPADYEALTERGLAHLKLGLVQQAKTDLDRSLKLNSSHQRTYWGLGKAGMQEGDYSTALVNLKKAIQIDPSFSPAYGDRALVYHRLARMFSGKFYAQEAISDYTQVIKLNPEDAQAYRDRAWFHLELGNDQLAIPDLQQAANLHAKQNQPEEHAEMIKVINALKSNPSVAKTTSAGKSAE